ncbi:acetone carboxylase subunit gamma [Desulfobacula sp.]|uniref:acetone carboxylase subunit gamma n=1 Tax=Desulfobacula sp. TaxID=2593537 RepID=UPI0026216B33|nr:acetone carboxylase subunit gamma [Desulfobacula sp.]
METNKRVAITEYLDLDIESDQWICSSCGKELISSEENYKKGCLVYGKDPREVHNPLIKGEFNFAPDPEWVRIIEFYCPECGVQIETEYLPLGHPITHDIKLDIASLKDKLDQGEFVIINKKLEIR